MEIRLQDHINVLELRAAFFALKSFLPTQQIHLPETRQHHSSLVSKQLGRHSLPATSQSSNSDLGLVREETPISSGTAYPRQNQCGSGYQVPSETGSE